MKRVAIPVGSTIAPTDPDARLSIQHTRNVVGAFYETLTRALVSGAVRWRGGPIPGPPGVEFEHRASLTPDLVIPGRSTFLEVKGGNAHSIFLPYVWQAQLYAAIRAGATAPIYRPRIEYVFYMHDLRGMVRTHQTTRALVAGLARHTLCGVLLDLDLVLAFEAWAGVTSYGDADDPERYYYPPFYHLRPAALRRLVHEPRACLAELVGPEKARRYGVQASLAGTGQHWRRGQSRQLPLLDGVLFGDTSLAPFPFVTVRKRRHRRSAYRGAVDRLWAEGVEQQVWIPEQDPVPF